MEAKTIRMRKKKKELNRHLSVSIRWKQFLSFSSHKQTSCCGYDGDDEDEINGGVAQCKEEVIGDGGWKSREKGKMGHFHCSEFTLYSLVTEKTGYTASTSTTSSIVKWKEGKWFLPKFLIGKYHTYYLRISTYIFSI